MLVLGLITCIVLRALSAQAKVVHSFEECKEFFYRGIEPSGMDQNAKKICQKMENSERSYFATLYSVSYKIPLYSAYTLDPACSSNPGRSQIFQLPRDFSGTIYDRGLLNPSSFQCGDGRAATYTMTNVAPIDACFNRDHWKNWERTLRGYLLKKLARDGDSAKAFIVTGTVPDPNVRIPDTDNVTVPSHIWTAVFYKHNSDDRKSFSFGYIGKNQPVDPDIQLMSVSDLNDELSRLYSKLSWTGQSVDYIGRNQPVDPDIRLKSVSDLNDELSRLYSKLSWTGQSVDYIGRNQPVDPDIRLKSVSDLNDELSGLYSELSGTGQSVDYIGRNQPVDPDIRLKSVSDLNDELSGLYSELSGTGQSVDYIEKKHLARLGIHVKSLRPSHRSPLRTFFIFNNVCLRENDELIKVIEEFKKLINLPVYQAVQMSSGIQDTYFSVNRDISSKSTSANNNNVRVSEMTVKLAFDNMSTYYNVAEDLKIVAGRACLITDAKPLMHNELRKREVSKTPDAVECQLVPEKQKAAADGSLCSDIRESDYICRCDTGGETKPCCSSPCLYQDKLKGYRCYSDQKLIECSPPYSLITYKGQRCLDDYPCATYGKDYYWCKTADSQDFCSPPLRNSKTIKGQYCRINHACAKYGSTYTWCYTDDKGNYDKCCTSDDCYSALNGQTCRFNHPCGYHGEYYLWCYTDYEGHWDYCCTNCG